MKLIYSPCQKNIQGIKLLWFYVIVTGNISQKYFLFSTRITTKILFTMSCAIFTGINARFVPKRFLCRSVKKHSFTILLWYHKKESPPSSITHTAICAIDRNTLAYIWSLTKTSHTSFRSSFQLLVPHVDWGICWLFPATLGRINIS